jgi:hypothetical protein
MSSKEKSLKTVVFINKSQEKVYNSEAINFN